MTEFMTYSVSSATLRLPDAGGFTRSHYSDWLGNSTNNNINDK